MNAAQEHEAREISQAAQRVGELLAQLADATGESKPFTEFAEWLDDLVGMVGAPGGVDAEDLGDEPHAVIAASRGLADALFANI